MWQISLHQLRILIFPIQKLCTRPRLKFPSIAQTQNSKRLQFPYRTRTPVAYRFLSVCGYSGYKSNESQSSQICLARIYSRISSNYFSCALVLPSWNYSFLRSFALFKSQSVKLINKLSSRNKVFLQQTVP